MPWSWDGTEWDNEAQYPSWKVFMAFHASSLGDASVPIDIGYVEESGLATGSLILPEPTWTDWSMTLQAVHGISRAKIQECGEPAFAWGRHLVAAIRRHQLFSESPQSDQPLLDLLLMAGGYERHTLQLMNVREAYIEACAPMIRGLPEGSRLQSKAIKAVQGLIDDVRRQERARLLQQYKHPNARHNAEELLLIWMGIKRRVGMMIAP